MKVGNLVWITKPIYNQSISAQIPTPLEERNTENLCKERKTCENFHHNLCSQSQILSVFFSPLFASLQNDKKTSQAVGNRLSFWPKWKGVRLCWVRNMSEAHRHGIFISTSVVSIEWLRLFINYCFDLVNLEICFQSSGIIVSCSAIFQKEKLVYLTKMWAAQHLFLHGALASCFIGQEVWFVLRYWT